MNENCNENLVKASYFSNCCYDNYPSLSERFFHLLPFALSSCFCWKMNKIFIYCNFLRFYQFILFIHCVFIFIDFGDKTNSCFIELIFIVFNAMKLCLGCFKLYDPFEWMLIICSEADLMILKYFFIIILSNFDTVIRKFIFFSYWICQITYYLLINW